MTNPDAETNELLDVFERELRILKWNELRGIGQSQDKAISGVNAFIEGLRSRAATRG